MSTHSVLGTATDKAFEKYTQEGFDYYNEVFTNPGASEKDIASAQARLWQTAEVINELNQMGGPSYNISPIMSSERVVLANPLYMSMLGAAEERGVLGAFVSPSTKLGKTATSLHGSNLSPEAYAVAFQKEFEKIEEQERQASEERAFKRDVGFSPESIPFYDSAGKRELIGSKDLLTKADTDIKKVTDINALPGASLMHITKIYGDLYNGYVAEGFSKEEAGKKARLEFRNRFEVIRAKPGKNEGELIEGFTGGDKPIQGAVYLLVDKKHQHQGYLYSLQSDEETRHRGIESFLRELQFLSTEDPLNAANAKVAEYQKEVGDLIIESMKKQQPSPYEPQTVQPVFDDKAFGSLRSNLERIEINPPRSEGEDVDAYMGRLLNKNAVISSFDQAFDLYTKGVSELYQPFEGEEQVDLFINNAVDAYMRQVKKGNPTLLRKQFKDIFFDADRSNVTGVKTFDPRISYMEERARELRVKQTLESEGITPYLGMVLSDEAARNFTDAREVAQNLEETQLDFRGFDLSDPDTNIFMYPVDDYNFVVVNQNGQTLNYKKDNKPFTFGIEDIGDAIQREQIKTPQDLWREIGKAINPQVKDVTREDLEKELTNYFDAFPNNLPLAYFVRRFKGNGKAVYQYYKQIKGQ